MRTVVMIGAALLAVVAGAATPAGPYDPAADGIKQLEDASRAARATNKRILVTVGGNW